MQEIFSKNEKLVIIMQNICEENEFDVALFYAYDAEKEILSAKDQPFVIPDDENTQKFLKTSQEIVVNKGKS